MSLLELLHQLPDTRRAQGRQYDLPHLLLFSIMAVASGADSYRRIQQFIHAHRLTFNQLFGLSWRRAPAHHSIRYALIGLEHSELERLFRQHSTSLAKPSPDALVSIAIDGKRLRGSVEHANDLPAMQLISAFCVNEQRILAHSFTRQNSQSCELEVACELIKTLAPKGALITLDALHTQKKPCSP